MRPRSWITSRRSRPGWMNRTKLSPSEDGSGRARERESEGARERETTSPLSSLVVSRSLAPSLSRSLLPQNLIQLHRRHHIPFELYLARHEGRHTVGLFTVEFVHRVDGHLQRDFGREVLVADDVGNRFAVDEDYSAFVEGEFDYGVEAGIFADPFANAFGELNHAQIIYLIRHLSFSL